MSQAWVAIIAVYRDKCLYGEHGNALEEGAVCSALEQGKERFHSIRGFLWILQDEQVLAKRTKREEGISGKAIAWQISWGCGTAWHLGNTADNGHG